MVIKLSILIVEDEPIIALNLKKNVEKNGYTVIGTADSGDTAIQLFKQYNPGLIFRPVMFRSVWPSPVYVPNSMAWDSAFQAT